MYLPTQYKPSPLATRTSSVANPWAKNTNNNGLYSQPAASGYFGNPWAKPVNIRPGAGILETANSFAPWKQINPADIYKSYGYGNNAHPYEFDSSLSENPNYGKWRSVANDAMNAADVSSEQMNYAALLGRRANGIDLASTDALKDANASGVAMARSLGATAGPRNTAARRSAAYQAGDVPINNLAAYKTASLQERNAAVPGAIGAYGDINKMIQMYTSQGMSQDQAQWAAMMELDRMKGEQHTDAQRRIAQIAAAGDRPSPWYTIGGSLLGAGAAAAFMSDERLKTDIKDAGDELYEFLETVGAHKYRYKDKGYSDREHFSPMAQELEKTSVGKSMVYDTTKGKAVNYGAGFGAILAAERHLHERLKRLEAQLER